MNHPVRMYSIFEARLHEEKKTTHEMKQEQDLNIKELLITESLKTIFNNIPDLRQGIYI